MPADNLKAVAAKLQAVQTALKAPKNQQGRFGAHRSAEGILEAVKPHLKEHQLVLTLSDDIVEVGGRNYIKATAAVDDGTGGFSATAMAWEGEVSRGLDASQVTGVASSYARKYALQGLFAIDDGKDADSQEYAKTAKSVTKAERPGKNGYATEAQRKEISRVLTMRGYDTVEAQKSYLESDMDETLPLTVGAASRVLDNLKGGDS